MGELKLELSIHKDYIGMCVKEKILGAWLKRKYIKIVSEPGVDVIVHNTQDSHGTENNLQDM